MKEPLISVIMALHNEERYVADTIQSIMKQTYRNWELIIVDDYSTDNSTQICKKFNDPRIRLYSKKNEPRYAACSRNIAINMAKGEYVIIHDADDYSEPTRFEKQLHKALEKPGRRVVGCSIKLAYNTKELILKMPQDHEKIIQGLNAGLKRMFNRVTIVAGTILAPKKILQKIPYREKFKYFEDWDLLLRLCESGQVEFYNCQEALYTYFIRPKGVAFKPDWLDYNIFDRNCQERRKKGLEEFKTMNDFFEYLNRNPVAKCKWLTIRRMIHLKKQLTLRLKLGF